MHVDLSSIPSSQPSSYPWNTQASLLDYLERARHEFGSRPAFSQEGKTLSFAEIDLASTHFAAYLQSSQLLKPGDRVAVQLPNILAYPIVVWGIIKAGFILVNVNPQYTLYETKRVLQDAGVSAWICCELNLGLVDSLRAIQPIPLVINCDLFAMHGALSRLFYRIALRTKKKHKKLRTQSPVLGLNEVLRRGARQSYQRPPLQAQDLVLLQYTGGSTGGLKGAMLTHQNLIANMEQVSLFLKPYYRPGEEVILAPLPIYHIFAFMVHCACPLIMGTHNILVTDPTHIAGLIKTCRRHAITALSGVNTLFHALTRHKQFRNLNFSTLRYAIAGGMKLDPKVGKLFEEITGRPILEGFGMTELSPVASINPPDQNRLGSIGKPMPFTDMIAIDNEGNPIKKPGTPGEMLVRGPQVMLGYWQQAEESAWHLLPGGWMRTGDLAQFDEDGYWYIVGRCKRMILVSGFNVYPQEIEAVLALHPDVQACRAIGIPHPISGESVKVLIVSRRPDLKASDIKEHCRQYLTSYKLPKQVEFFEKLPLE